MKTSYRERDNAFGRIMLTLRTEVGLTQEGLASSLGVSRRAVGEWEAGNSYPKAKHLKDVIALAVKGQAFPKGSEVEEIRVIWKAARQKVLLDEDWLCALLDEQQARHLRLVPKPVEETMTGGTRRGTSPPVEPHPTPGPRAPVASPRVDWGDALAVPTFYGREQERAQLTQWVVQEHCQVVSVLGMGGIGQSALSVSIVTSV